MRYKKTLVSGILAASVTTVGIVQAVTHPDPQPVKEQIVKSAKVDAVPTRKIVTKKVAPVETQSSQAQTERATPINTLTTSNTPAQNKAQLKTAVDEMSARIGVDADIQWYCIDKLVTISTGYKDYNNIMTKSIANPFLNPTQNDDGTYTYMTFRNRGACQQAYITK